MLIYPANKSFTVNKMRAQCYLDTVEVRSSSLLVPTIPFKCLQQLAQKRLACLQTNAEVRSSFALNKEIVFDSLETPADRVAVKMHTVFHHVEHLAATDARAAGKDRG